jgi:chromosome segregation ATPase
MLSDVVRKKVFMTSNKSIARLTSRRLEIQRQLAEILQVEIEQHVLSDIQDNPQYKKLAGKLEELRSTLHRHRVVVSRKGFAIQVRNRRLKNIPKEIKNIEREKVAEESEVARLESEQSQLIAAIEEIKTEVASRLKKTAEVAAIPN